MDKNTCNNINQEELEELEETLSFCDLLEYQDLDQSLSFHHSQNSPSHELFQFPFISNTPLNNKNDIIFCGKLIKEQQFDDNEQSRYLFPLSSARQLNNNKKDLGSLCLVNSKPNPSLPTKSFRSQSCSSFRKHKVLIGLAKIPPKMELSDIRKRQSRRNPSPMFPPMATGDLEVMDAGDGCGAGSRRRGWSLLRPFRCSAHLASVLTKASFGCIPRV